MRICLVMMAMQRWPRRNEAITGVRDRLSMANRRHGEYGVGNGLGRLNRAV